MPQTKAGVLTQAERRAAQAATLKAEKTQEEAYRVGELLDGLLKHVPLGANMQTRIITVGLNPFNLVNQDEGTLTLGCVLAMAR